MNSEVKIIIQHTGLVLDHLLESSQSPSVLPLSQSGNSVIVQILSHGEMGDDTDLAQAITETELILAALRLAAERRGR